MYKARKGCSLTHSHKLWGTSWRPFKFILKWKIFIPNFHNNRQYWTLSNRFHGGHLPTFKDYVVFFQLYFVHIFGSRVWAVLQFLALNMKVSGQLNFQHLWYFKLFSISYHSLTKNGRQSLHEWCFPSYIWVRRPKLVNSQSEQAPYSYRGRARPSAETMLAREACSVIP